MNWLERARREIKENIRRPTANSAERTPTAVMAVPPPAIVRESMPSIGSNGSTLPARIQETDSVRENFEERAAIIEFDGGLSHDEAKRIARARVLNRQRLN